MLMGNKHQRPELRPEAQPDSETIAGPWHSLKKFMTLKRFVHMFVLLIAMSIFLAGVMPVGVAADISPPGPSRNSVVAASDTDEDEQGASPYRVEQVEDDSDVEGVNDDANTGSQTDDQTSGENTGPSESEETTDTPEEPSNPPSNGDDEGDGAGDGAPVEDGDEEEVPPTEPDEETKDQKPSDDAQQQDAGEPEVEGNTKDFEESSDYRWYKGAEGEDVGTIVINNGGSRASDGTVTGLKGSVFVAIAENPEDPDTKPELPADLSDESLYYCTTGVHDKEDTGKPGSCSIKIPHDTNYWVLQFSNPEGWDRIEGFMISVKTMSHMDYAFKVRTSIENPVYTLTDKTALGMGSTQWFSVEGNWANARTNPEFPKRCSKDPDLKIAMVFDQSGSILEGEQSELKEAALSFISTEGLGGTQTQVGLYTFGTVASRMLGPTSLSTKDGINAVTAAINLLPDAPEKGQSTNWDAALRIVQEEKWDAVLMITDGNPTTSEVDGGGSQGASVNFKDVEDGVFTANALKEAGTAVISVGIGPSSEISRENLEVISGPDDAYMRYDFEKLKQVLHLIAQRARCLAQVTAYKTLQSESGTQWGPYAGWPIKVTLNNEFPPGTDPTITLVDEETQETAGELGNVSWDIFYAHARGPVASVTTRELMPEGLKASFVHAMYEIEHAQDGSTTSGIIYYFGEVTLDIGIGDNVKITFTNRQSKEQSWRTVEWTKVDENGELLGGSEWSIGSINTMSFWVTDNTGSPDYEGRDLDPEPGKFKVGELRIEDAYGLIEMTAPDGYILDQTLHRFSITEDEPNYVFTEPIVNVPKSEEGGLTWTKVDDEGEKLAGSVWKVTGPGTDLEVVDYTGQTGYTGADKDPAAGSFKVEKLETGDYELVEITAPPGYVLGTVSHKFTISTGALNHEAGKFINYPITVPTLPLTGGTSSDTFFIAGGIILLITTAAIIFLVRRRRMMRK